MKYLIAYLFALLSVLNLEAQEHQISLISPGALVINRVDGYKLNNPTRYMQTPLRWFPSLEYIHRSRQSSRRDFQISLLWLNQEYPEVNSGLDSIIKYRDGLFLNISRLIEKNSWSNGDFSFFYGLSAKYSTNYIFLYERLNTNWSEAILRTPVYEFSFLGFNGGFHLNQQIWRRLYFSSTLRAVVFPIPVSYIGAKLDRYSLWFENGIGIRFGKK